MPQPVIEYAKARNLPTNMVDAIASALGRHSELTPEVERIIDTVAAIDDTALRDAMLSSVLIADREVTAEDARTFAELANYHPRLAIAALTPPPSPELGFFADGILSFEESEAIRKAHSVFGLEAFYSSWQLQTLKVNEVQAILAMLVYYDPFTTLHDITADPDDPDAEGAELNRTLDQFGVHPGECVYCKGQRYYQSYIGEERYAGHETREREPLWEERVAYGEAIEGAGAYQRNKLIALIHHAKVQGDALSPCDLARFDEAALIALGTGNVFGLTPPFVASTRLTQRQIDAGLAADSGAWANSRAEWAEELRWRESTVQLKIPVGEILSPFTHASSIVGDFGDRSFVACREAAIDLLEWLALRYRHYLGWWDAHRSLFLDTEIFPQNPFNNPEWSHLLVFEHGNKWRTVLAVMRSYNIPSLFFFQLEEPQVGYFSPEEELEPFLYTDDAYPEAKDGFRVIGDILFPGLHANIHHNFGYVHTNGKAVTPFDREKLLNPLPTECRFVASDYPFIPPFRFNDHLSMICEEDEE